MKVLIIISLLLNGCQTYYVKKDICYSKPLPVKFINVNENKDIISNLQISKDYIDYLLKRENTTNSCYKKLIYGK